MIRDAELAKATLLLRTNFNSTKRRYIYSLETEETYDKKYTYVEPDRQLLRFANDYFGTFSDCFILYAVAVLGVADRKTIQLFLRNMKARNPDLYIEDPANEANLKARISALEKCGFLFSIGYFYKDYTDESNVKQMPVRLYTIGQEGMNFMNRKLQKRIAYNKWMQALSFNELLATAASAYVGAWMATTRYFREQLDGVFRNRSIGVYYLPAEMKFQRGEDRAYVAVVSSFLNFDKRIYSQQDYNQVCVNKINLIKSYLTNRTTKGIAYVVVTVHDNNDLLKMAKLILETGVLLEDLERIYFTSEGAMRCSDEVNQSFLKMSTEYDENKELTFDFYYAEPDFM